MAKSATIFKADLDISDLDRGYYQSHRLTIAQHPSETQLRMMVRLLIFALNAHEQLQFTKGLSTDEEPDLWAKTLTGDIDLWIEVGQPSLKRVKKACNQSAAVKIYPFSGRGGHIWWQQNINEFARLKHLQIINLPGEQLSDIEQCVSRTMALHCTIQDGIIWFGDAQTSIEIKPEIWKNADR